MRNEDIICISSIDWDFIWQGHQEIMSALARDGNRILFIENTGVRAPNLRDLPRLKKRALNWFYSVKGIRKEQENLYLYSPLILPFPYSRVARWINRHLLISSLENWIRTAGFSKPIIWTFLPTALVLDIIDAIDNKMVIYYCIDNFAASSTQARRIRKTEEALLRKADVVFVTAKNLYDMCSKHNNNVHIFPYGVNIDIYEKARSKEATVPKDMALIKHPAVGYIGGIHKWIDFKLLKFLADSHPDKAFVLIGPLQRDISEFNGLKNVYFLGQKRYEELPSYISQFDICVIPYLLTEYTKNVYPTKINEYLSLGKPVLSTAIPEVESFNMRNDNIIFIGRTKEAFSSAIDKILSEGTNEMLYNKRIYTAAREGSWRTKIKEMSALIERTIADKEKERSIEWKSNILRLYKKSKNRLIPILAGALLMYLFLFHTSFIWFIARPLKISNPPEKSDVIVVLAGGVGESGKAGQGYEERIQYGVDLYKKRYAPYLIFSSGFKYAIEEAEVMRALALSLGVPDEAIILEENARNTYENIKFSREIMVKKGWKKAILISSPYHMLRVSLVCEKTAQDIYFRYAPVPKSIFYGDEKTVRPKHIYAIFHEYLGILYYGTKGYIRL